MPSIIKRAGNLPFTDSVKIPDVKPKYTNDGQEELDLEQELTENLENDIENDVEQEKKVYTEEDFVETDVEELEVVEEPVEVDENRVQELLQTLTKEELREIFSEELEVIELAVSKEAYKVAYKSAYDEAYDKTILQRKGEIQECIQNVNDGILQMQEQHKIFLKEYTTELKYLAIDIAEKIILQKIAEDELILTNLVKKTVLEIKNTSWFDIEVSDKLVGLVDTLRKDLAVAMPNTRVTISPKPIPSDSCRVNTSEGTVVSSVSAQASNLRNIFEKSEI